MFVKEPKSLTVARSGLKYLFIVCCAHLFFYHLGEAQIPHYGYPSVANYAKSDYDGGTQNWAAVQDGRGVVYFGNNKGVLEFDGVRWNAYPLPNRTIVRSLAIDEAGRIYVGGQDELGYLEEGGLGEPRYVSLIEYIPKAYRSFEDVWRVFPIGEGVFFCTQRTIFLWKAGKMLPIEPAGRFDGFFELGGRVYVRDTEQGLCFWNGQELELVPDGAPFKDILIVAILPYQEGQALVATSENGLFLMDDGSIRPWKAAVSTFLEEYRVFCAARLSGGLYALGTTSNGLLLMDQEGKAVAHLNKQFGLQNNTVLCIYEDLSQNLWLGLDNGIDYVELSAPFSIIGSKQGVEGTGYASILHDGKLFFGTNQGLFYTQWTRGVDPFDPPPFQRVEGANGQVWSLAEAGGQLMVCHHEGLFYYRSGRVFPVDGVKGAWKFLELAAFPGYAILGAYSGLYLLEKSNVSKGGAAWKILNKLQGFDESARLFEEDEEGDVWVSHAYKGLYRIKLDMERRAIAETQLYDSKQGLPTDLYIDVVKIRGELAFTTPKGVYYFDRESGRFEEDPELSAVIGAGKDVHCMLEDELKNIWFSADDEFGVLEVEEKGLFNEVNKRYFNAVQDELVDGFEHVFASSHRNVFIASERGFIQYTPSLKGHPQYPFRALIRKVAQLNGAEKLIWGGGLDFREAASDSVMRNAVFPYRDNSFRFSFSAPFFEENKAVQYRYRLDGFGGEWSEWGLQAEKDYTNLPHGEYAFRVEARNAYAQRSAEAVYSFAVRPPWYLTTLAKVWYALLGIALVFGAFQYTGRRIEKQRKALLQAQEKELRQREEAHRQEVAQSEAEIIRLRNEKLKADVQHKTSKLASATMHLVQKGEILLEIKNGLNKLLNNAAPENKKKVKQLIRAIDEDIRLDDNWEQFELHFDQVHENFLKRLREKYPVLTPKDQKLCAYLRMNLTTKEIAPLMNISVRGVEISRYRLRKKLDLDSDTNLVEFIMGV